MRRLRALARKLTGTGVAGPPLVAREAARLAVKRGETLDRLAAITGRDRDLIAADLATTLARDPRPTLLVLGAFEREVLEEWFAAECPVTATLEGRRRRCLEKGAHALHRFDTSAPA